MVLVTAEHYRSSLMHDATSVWLEDVSASSFKICLRELQNFAGVHDDISVVCIIKFSIIHFHQSVSESVSQSVSQCVSESVSQ